MMLASAAVKRHFTEIGIGSVAERIGLTRRTRGEVLLPVQINIMDDSGEAGREVTSEQPEVPRGDRHPANEQPEVSREDNQPINEQQDVPPRDSALDSGSINIESEVPGGVSHLVNAQPELPQMDSGPNHEYPEEPPEENQPINVVQVGSVNRCYIHTEQPEVQRSGSHPVNEQQEVPCVDSSCTNQELEELSVDSHQVSEQPEVQHMNSSSINELPEMPRGDIGPINERLEVPREENQPINVNQVGYVNRCVIHTEQGRNTEVNINYNILPEPPLNAASTLDIRGSTVRVKMHFPNLNIDETVLREVQENRTTTEDILKQLLFGLVEVRTGCVELVTKPDCPEAISHMIQAIKDGKLDQIVLDILKNDAVKLLTDTDKINVDIDIFVPSDLEHLLDVAKGANRPNVLWPTSSASPSSSASIVERPHTHDDLSMDSPTDSHSITASTQQPRLNEEDIGLQYLFRHIHRRFPRDRLEELQTHCCRRLGNAYVMEGELVTSTLDFLHQLSKRGHVTRNNVTLLWTLMLDLNCPGLLEAVLDYEESVEAQVRDWLDLPDVWTHYGYITCCLSPHHKFLPAKYVQRLTTTVREATGTNPSHVLVRWRTVGGPLSVTMVIVRKVQEADSKTDLKEELKRLGVDTIEVGADISNLRTRPNVQLQHVRRWWILESQTDINRFHRQWKSTRKRFIQDLRSYQSIFSRPCNIMMLGLTGVGKSSCINSLVAAVTGDGFREVSYAGWHGTIVEPVTMSTQRYINCGVTEADGNLFPTLFDTMGFPDEATAHLRVVTDRYIGGYISTEVPTAQLLEYAQDHGWHSLCQRYNKYYPEHDVDRIIYVLSARQQTLPFSHMKVIKETAAGRPIYLLITKTDVVENLDLESFKERARNALGIDKDRVFVMINYTDETTPDRITRMYPALDEANVKILMSICCPVEWDQERKSREEAHATREEEAPAPDPQLDKLYESETEEPPESRFTIQTLSKRTRLQYGVLRGILGLLSLLAVIIAIYLHIGIAQKRFSNEDIPEDP